MTATEKWVEDAIKGGWKEYEAGNNTLRYYTNTVLLHKVLLDPLAWQAVGKTRGWKNAVYETHWHTKKAHIYYMHEFIDHLADGKTIDEALQAIE